MYASNVTPSPHLTLVSDQADDYAAPSTRFTIDDWTVNVSALEVERGGAVRHLTPKAMACLAELAVHYPEPCTREDLLNAVWGKGRGGDEALSQVIAEIRRKLGDSARQARFVRTLSKRGYQMTLPPTWEEVRSEPLIRPGRSPRLRRTGVLAAWLGCLTVAAVTIVFLTRPAGKSSLSDHQTSGFGPVTAIAQSAVGEVHPRMAPSGNLISYSLPNPDNDSLDIAIKRRDTGQQWILATPGSDEFSPVVDDTRDRLAYLSYSDGSCRVMLSTMTGDFARSLADCLSLGPATSLDLSPDGQYVAYTMPTDRTTLGRGIGVLRIESGEHAFHIVPETSALSYYGPRFSPDSKQLIFRTFSNASAISSLMVFDLADQTIKSLDLWNLGGADWLDDESIVIVESGAFLTRLIALRSNLSVAAELAVIPEAADLDMLPDGLLFSHRRDRPAGLNRLSAGQSYLTPVIDHGGHDHSPAVNGRGTMLAHAERGSDRETLWLTNLSSGASRRLAEQPDARILGLTWSPTGDSIVFSRLRPDGFDLVLADIDGGEEQVIDHGCGMVTRLRFGPNDGRLYALAYASAAAPAICRIDPSDASRPARSEIVSRPGVFRFGFDQDGALILSSFGSAHIYRNSDSQPLPWSIGISGIPIAVWDTSDYGVVMLSRDGVQNIWTATIQGWGEPEATRLEIPGLDSRSSIALDGRGNLYFASGETLPDSDILFMPLARVER